MPDHIDGVGERLDAVPSAHRHNPTGGDRLDADKGLATTEDALALDLVDRHPDVRWVERWKKWLMWDGKYWAADDVLMQFDRIRSLCRETARQANDRKTSAVLKRSATVAAIERMARSDRRYAATVEQWDQDPLLINTPNAIIDLENGNARPHDPRRYMSKLTRGQWIGHDWAAYAPRWRTFLDEVTDGDAELQSFLQRLAGYACTGSAREHVLAFVLGPGGNGKGTLFGALAHALGDYATTMPENFLAEQRRERHPTELARLRGARLAMGSETEAGARWNEVRLKALTGGDRITARGMHQDFYEFDPTHTLVMLANNPPRIRSVDDAIRRRIRVVPLTRRVPEPDAVLPETLKGEADGIMSWAIVGARDWLRTGLGNAGAVTDATNGYFDSEDELGEWLERRCEVDPSCEISKPSLWNAYHRDMEDSGMRGLGKIEFGNEISKRGFKDRRTKAERIWCGLRLKTGGG